MNTKTIAKAALAAALTVFALTSCHKDRHRHDPERPDPDPVVPEEQVTEGLKIIATYFGDYYKNSFHDYILLFQLGETDEEGAFKTSGVELSLDILTAQGGPTYFPAGLYEISDANLNSAGIIPSIEEKDDEGNISYGDTYLYTQQDSENYWLEAVENATLDVAVNGSQYTIKVVFIVDGEEYSYLYKGTLAIADKSSSGEEPPLPDGPEGDYEFVPDGASAFNYGHEWGNDTDDWMIYLTNSKDEDEWLAIEIVADAASNISVLPTGNFNVPANFYDLDVIPAGTLCPLYTYDESYLGTFYAFGGMVWNSPTSGNLKISKSGDNYTIAISFIDGDYDNAQITSTYVGPVEVNTENYYDGSVSVARKAVPASKKVVAKRTSSKRQLKSAKVARLG